MSSIQYIYSKYTSDADFPEFLSGGGTGGLMAGLARTSAKLHDLESSLSGQATAYSSGELLTQLKHEQQAQLDREVFCAP